MNTEPTTQKAAQSSTQPGTLPHPEQLILFDGVCNLCNSTVKIVLSHDPKHRFHFAPLQSEKAQQLLKQYDLLNKNIDSIIYIEKGKAYSRSTAALKIARRMNGAYPLFYAFMIIPGFIRNGVYKWIAANRYKWFGQQESCMIPTPEVRAQFLDW